MLKETTSWSHQHPINGRYFIAPRCSDQKRREPKREVDSDDSEEEDESEDEPEEESQEERPAAASLPNQNPNNVTKGPVKAAAVKGPPQELTRKERLYALLPSSNVKGSDGSRRCQGAILEATRSWQDRSSKGGPSSTGHHSQRERRESKAETGTTFDSR